MRSLILDDCKICTNCSACSSSPKSIAAALTFRCASKETFPEAAGKTIADDKYIGVIRNETTMETMAAKLVMMIIGFLFFQINWIKPKRSCCKFNCVISYLAPRSYDFCRKL